MIMFSKYSNNFRYWNGFKFVLTIIGGCYLFKLPDYRWLQVAKCMNLIWRAVCFKINFFIGYKFLISFADRIYRPVIDQLKYCYIVLIFYQRRKIDQPAYHQSVICLVNSIICLYDRSVVRNQP